MRILGAVILLLIAIGLGALILYEESRCHGSCPHHKGCVEKCWDANYCPYGEGE